MGQTSQPASFSLMDLLPNNYIIGDVEFMVLRSYFDGGNQDDSSQYETLSLASVSAIHDDWIRFEIDWRKILLRYFGDKLGYLHTTYAVTGNEIYEGWGVSKTRDFLSDCVNTAITHLLEPKNSRYPGFQGKYGLFGFVITIAPKPFIEHAKSDPSVPQSANEVCLRQTLAQILEWSEHGANPRCDECHFFFDQGEPFYGHLVQLLQNKKAKRDALSLERITSRTETDMRRVPALQLADLLAWSQGHKMDEDKPEWHERILASGFSRHWIDRITSADTMPDQQAIWNSWGLPKHRATR